MPSKTSNKPNVSPTPPGERTNPAEASDAVSLQPAERPHPAAVGDEQVRARAYFLWEQAGRPDGDGAEFWLRAEQELKSRGASYGTAVLSRRAARSRRSTPRRT